LPRAPTAQMSAICRRSAHNSQHQQGVGTTTQRNSNNISRPTHSSTSVKQKARYFWFTILNSTGQRRLQDIVGERS